MKYFDTIDARTIDGFDIVCAVTPEDTHPRDSFDETPEDMAEMCRKIDLGLLDWFVVRVQAYRCGVLLGESYLGGNLYNNAREFVTESGGYYDDLIFEAIGEANKTLNSLVSTVHATI